ncbi:MAG: cellulase family glycosylhydrolase [Cyclobacteriaceae bacterium]|nr:cellulase family glycosylhydrolase [Cyclobacteriaceae bacterium]
MGCGQKPETTKIEDINASNIPRWRGFNLLEKFIVTSMNDPFRESDFEMIAELGFDFVRLPMSYWCWSDPNNWKELRDKPLKEIDEAVEFGKQHGVHVSLNFHRAPGYSVDRSAQEPFNLWLDEEAQEAFDYHWTHFAERYKGIPNTRLSFNLVNEPATLTIARKEPVPLELHDKVMRRVVKAIREVDPDRLIIADGLWWAREPIPSLADLNVVQSTRGYEPIQITHYLASWVDGAASWPEPTWPLDPVESTELRWSTDVMNQYYKNNLAEWGVSLDQQWNAERIRLQMIDPWKRLEDKGVSVHVGEFGAYSRTPHQVVLKWMRELMSQWKNSGWGWAMWNFRGGFGILDSGRDDVNYEDYKGHKLDREMLEILREF